MKITIFAATGGIGRQILQQAVDAGHEVAAAVRPPRLTSKPPSGSYRISLGRSVRCGATISRADVAHLMLRLIGDAEAFGQSVGVAY